MKRRQPGVPFATLTAEALGITSADVRTIDYMPNSAWLRVRTWNRRTLYIPEYIVLRQWLHHGGRNVLRCTAMSAEFPYYHGDKVSVSVGDEMVDAVFFNYRSADGLRWAQVEMRGSLYEVLLEDVSDRHKPSMWEVPTDVV